VPLKTRKVFLVLDHDRRRILHFNVIRHPTAEWTGQQLREAFPFNQSPRYLLRDRDAIFVQDFRVQVRDIGIEEVLSTPRGTSLI
jgi:putative transposase